MHYEITNQFGVRVGRMNDLATAKKEAERLCNSQRRKVHFHVFKIEQVWSTSTLDELGVDKS